MSDFALMYIPAENVYYERLDKTLPDIGITEGILDGLHWDQVHLERGILTNTSTLDLSGNATDNLCLWEVRAVDVDSDQTLASQQPVGANTPDWPPPYPPDSLGYGLDVPLHTGINNIDVVAEDCAGWEKTIFIQIVYVIPQANITPIPRTLWHSHPKVWYQYDGEFQTLFDYVNVASDVFGPDVRNIYGPVAMDNYRTILVPRSGGEDPTKGATPGRLAEPGQRACASCGAGPLKAAARMGAVGRQRRRLAADVRPECADGGRRGRPDVHRQQGDVRARHRAARGFQLTSAHVVGRTSMAPVG